jgi:hypothetical protein
VVVDIDTERIKERAEQRSSSGEVSDEVKLYSERDSLEVSERI